MLNYRQQRTITLLVFTISSVIPIYFFIGGNKIWIASFIFSASAMLNHWAERNLEPLSYKLHGAALMFRNLVWLALTGRMTLEIFRLHWTLMSPSEALILGICAFVFIANSLLGFGFDTLQFIPKAVGVYLINRARMGFKATLELNSRIESVWDQKPIPTFLIGVAGVILSIWFM